MSGGQLDYLRNFHTVFAVGNIVNKLFKNAGTLSNFVHSHLEASHGIAFATHNFVKFKFAVYAVRVSLAHIARPAGCSSARACNAPGNCVFPAQDTNSLHTVFSYHIAGEELVVFFKIFGNHCEQSLNIVYKIGGKILHHSTDTLVIECHSGSASLVHYIKNLFTNSERIEKHCGSTEVHTECTDKQAMRCYTRQLIHHNSYHLGTATDFNAGSLFNSEAESMVIGMSREIV